MGKLTYNFKNSIIDDIVSSINANTAHFYAFASNPIEQESIPTISNNNYDIIYSSVWPMIFGKKLQTYNVVPMIDNKPWQTNTVYTAYNNLSNTLNTDDYFVVTPPPEVGGAYSVFKCIKSPANGAASTEIPDQLQKDSFTKEDGYTWRYLYSISTTNYIRFATDEYIPVYTNSSISVDAEERAGIENVLISNAGSGYDAYHQGKIKGLANSTVLQIESSASDSFGYYVNSAIYIYNNTAPTSAELKVVTGYQSNLTGKWVTLDSAANLSNIIENTTDYIISPRVVFDTDADDIPKAYTTINTTSNSIHSVVIIDAGCCITRANASIVSSFGSGANLQCIVPPPGGHGFDPAIELPVKAVGINFSFVRDESNTIPTNITYNKIGILKNPNTLLANGQQGSAYTANSFNQLLDCTVSETFTVGTTVTGQTSTAKAIVAFANSTTVYLAGDKSFSNGEVITDGTLSSTISINSLGDLFYKNITPLYVENIADVQRTSSQTESFKIIIQV